MDQWCCSCCPQPPPSAWGKESNELGLVLPQLLAELNFFCMSFSCWFLFFSFFFVLILIVITLQKPFGPQTGNFVTFTILLLLLLASGNVIFVRIVVLIREQPSCFPFSTVLSITKKGLITAKNNLPFLCLPNSNCSTAYIYIYIYYTLLFIFQYKQTTNLCLLTVTRLSACRLPIEGES